MAKILPFAFLLLGLSLTQAISGEIEERHKIVLEARSLLTEGRYVELDELAARYRDNEERTSSGVWKLPQFYHSFTGLMDIRVKEEAYWDRFDTMSSDYMNARPQSPTAIIMRARYFYKYAWKFRGGGWARDVPRAAWVPFFANIRRANQVLLEGKDIASVDPEWYTLRAEILNADNSDPFEFDANLQEGAAAFPTYSNLWFRTMLYYLPRWHGDAGKIDALADYATSFSEDEEGQGMYTRIYWYASETEFHQASLFRNSEVDWERMKVGINDILAEYPNQWNIQNFARFACLKEDLEFASKLMERVTIDPISDVDDMAVIFGLCNMMIGARNR